MWGKFDMRRHHFKNQRYHTRGQKQCILGSPPQIQSQMNR